ncbi:hypothetical protein GCM10010378_47230 [Streptomyces viridochromogenes]
MKTTRSSTDVHMGRLPGDDHAVTRLDDAHSRAPPAYSVRTRRNCRAIDQVSRDSLCAAMRAVYPPPPRTHLSSHGITVEPRAAGA